jgi:Sugar kinases, ribokinase family
MVYDVVCVGENCVDFIVKIDGKIVKGENFVCSEMKVTPGGTGLNFAVTASRLGLKTCYLSTLGIDSYANLLREKLENENVYMPKVPELSSDLPTALIFAIIDNGGEKTTLAFIHGTAYEEFDLKPGSIIEEGKALFVSAGLFTAQKCTRSAISMMKKAKMMNVQVIFDPQLRIGKQIPEFLEWVEDGLKHCDVVLLNENELNLLRKGETKESINKLIEEGIKIVGVKTGEKGCVIGSKDGVISVPPFKVKALNTLGSGDVFDAAFVKGLLEKKPLEKIGIFANGAAALSTLETEPVDRAPTCEKVESFLSQQV